MTDFIELAKGKLNDPILMEWALDRYRGAEKGDLRPIVFQINNFPEFLNHTTL
jgi:hypothetical protein